ncbi:hypothetical protein CS542_08080 [Pedobacter sp. IW39]|nr:hypothetical protein CS542_08080 [Pedobacter sp. IW39]
MRGCECLFRPLCFTEKVNVQSGKDSKRLVLTAILERRRDVIDQASLEYLNKQYGLLPLPSASGIDILSSC